LIYTDENNSKCEDLLNSDDAVQNFYVKVVNSRYSVYAISGGWGTGKTCFVKMWENRLEEKEQVYVHIDAFKMDYESEPFLMLIKTFKDFLRKKNIDENKTQQLLKKAKEVFSVDKLLKLGANVLIEKTVGVKPIKEFLNDLSNSYFDKLTAEKSLYDELVSTLNEITNQFDKPVYIIIDELDRCRPDFALETLERIKHVFNVKNVKYILVYNEDAMKSIIRKKYGIKTNPERYLNKFVQKTYQMDNTKQYINWFHHEVGSKIERFDSISMPDILRAYAESILNIKRLYNLGFRDIQYILSNLRNKYRCSTRYEYLSVICLEFLKFVNEDEYQYIIENLVTIKAGTVNSSKRDTLNDIVACFKEGRSEDLNEKHIFDYIEDNFYYVSP
jgi:predicted KAP-like P-loop ATPase